MSEPRPTILIIEDEPALQKFLRVTLSSQDYNIIEATRGEEGLRHAAVGQPDLIVLDLGLPDMDGLEVTRRLREWSAIPIIVVSARGKEQDKVVALDAGADDYLTKPFHLPELSARVKALLRRKYADGNTIVDLHVLRIDLASRTVAVEGQPVALSKIEYDLLVFLVTNKNRVVSRQAIAEHLFDGPSDQAPGPEFAYSHIKNLKKKLKDKGCPEIIQTIYGLGYKLVI